MPMSVNTSFTLPQPVTAGGAEARTQTAATEQQRPQERQQDSARPERVVQGEVLRITRDLDAEALSLQSRQASNESLFQRNNSARLLNASPQESFREIDRLAQEENTQAGRSDDNLVDVFA